MQWCARKPDWRLSRYPFEFKYLFSWLKTTFSIILTMKGRFDIGLLVAQHGVMKIALFQKGLNNCNVRHYTTYSFFFSWQTRVNRIEEWCMKCMKLYLLFILWNQGTYRAWTFPKESNPSITESLSMQSENLKMFRVTHVQLLSFIGQI